MDNLWEMIAKARGVELDEEFIWVSIGSNYKYKITTCGLYIFVAEQWGSACTVNEFIAGAGTIKKIPFRPQKGDTYYTPFSNTLVLDDIWAGNTVDYARLIAGVVFRTIEEAESYLPTWKERISKL